MANHRCASKYGEYWRRLTASNAQSGTKSPTQTKPWISINIYMCFHLCSWKGSKEHWPSDKNKKAMSAHFCTICTEMQRLLQISHVYTRHIPQSVTAGLGGEEAHKCLTDKRLPIWPAMILCGRSVSMAQFEAGDPIHHHAGTDERLSREVIRQGEGWALD